MDIGQKSIGFLIDELITTSIKCWFAQEVVMNSEDGSEIATAARRAQLTNARRNALIRAIDKRLGEGDISPTDKSYA